MAGHVFGQWGSEFIAYILSKRSVSFNLKTKADKALKSQNVLDKVVSYRYLDGQLCKVQSERESRNPPNI